MVQGRCSAIVDITRESGRSMRIGVGVLGACCVMVASGCGSMNGWQTSLANHGESVAISIDDDHEPQVEMVLDSFEESIPGALVEFTMISIPAGEITVPDPADPSQSKTISVGPFHISQTEVTWDLFDVFVYALDEEDASPVDGVARPTKPYLPPDRGFGHNGYPAISLTYHAAAEYCQWLSVHTGRKYRLPTEAEWQYAIAAGSTGAYSFGNDPAMLGEHAWFADNAKGKTQAVAKKKPNAWGLYDGHANVAEWCVDFNGDPVACGGTYYNAADECRLDSRMRQNALWNASDPQLPKSKWWLADCSWVGLRVICEPDDADAETTPEGK